MRSQYKLPDWMGGHACTLHVHSEGVGLSTVDVTSPDGSWTYRITVPRAMLTVVEPALPEEPPNGTVISDGADAWIRCDDENGGDSRWFVTGSKQAWTWAEMQAEIGGPKWRTYVPDLASNGPVLPWEYRDEDRIRFGVELHRDEPLVAFDSTCPRYYMPLAQAEEMAFAILRAGRELRAES